MPAVIERKPAAAFVQVELEEALTTSLAVYRHTVRGVRTALAEREMGVGIEQLDRRRLLELVREIEGIVEGGT